MDVHINNLSIQATNTKPFILEGELSSAVMQVVTGKNYYGKVQLTFKIQILNNKNDKLI